MIRSGRRKKKAGSRMRKNKGKTLSVWKKALILVLTAAMTVPLLTGCGSGKSEKSGASSSTESSASAKETTASSQKSSADSSDSGVQRPKALDAYADSTEISADVEKLLEVTDTREQKAVELAAQKVKEEGGKPRIIATSPATAQICDKLELDLVGVCSTTTSYIPERYAKLPKVGTAMSPDMEIVSSLKPDWILSPSSLQSDQQPKYEELDTDWAFLNLKSVTGMYRSMQELGKIFGKEEQANKAVAQFSAFYEQYKEKNKGKKHPKVLILMGLPGSYIIATENSYVGSLVELAGGENVYAGTDEEFLTVNTEDIKTKEPDIILRAAHALPDQVVDMFNEEFQTNDIWKHFDAVKNGRVYDLTYSYFGMSANFYYPEALKELQVYMYPEKGEKGLNKAKKQSEKAAGKAESTHTKGTDAEKAAKEAAGH